MTMETNLSKRDWITELWNETEHDEALREFIFEAVIEDMEAEARDIASEREDMIRGEMRDEIRKEWREDPPDDLRATVIKGLLEYPPSGMDDALEPWRELEAKFEEEARANVENEIGDLELTIETLREENARLKGVEYKPQRRPSTPKKKGRAKR